MSAWTCRSTDGKAADKIVPPRLRIPYWKGLGADSEEKHEPASDIDTVVVDSLKALDPKRPIREADVTRAHPSQGQVRAQIVVELKPELPFEIAWGSEGGAEFSSSRFTYVRFRENSTRPVSVGSCTGSHARSAAMPRSKPA